METKVKKVSVKVDRLKPEDWQVPDINFTRKAVLKITGTKAENLRNWYDRGFIQPSIKEGGQGRPNKWNLVDIVKLKMFNDLLQSGFKLAECRRIVDSDIVKKTLDLSLAQISADYRELRKARISGRKTFFPEYIPPKIAFAYIQKKPDEEISIEILTKVQDFSMLYYHMGLGSPKITLTDLTGMIMEILEQIDFL